MFFIFITILSIKPDNEKKMKNVDKAPKTIGINIFASEVILFTPAVTK